MQPTQSSDDGAGSRRSRGEPARTRTHRRTRGGARRLALILYALLTGDSSARSPLVEQWRSEPVDEQVPPPRAHFLVGNETRHDLFAPVITGRGGAYLGVGGDQNYTLVAVSRASLVFLATLGGLAARTGGAPLRTGVVRVTLWGALAMGATALVGSLFGIAA